MNKKVVKDKRERLCVWGGVGWEGTIGLKLRVVVCVSMTQLRIN